MLRNNDTRLANYKQPIFSIFSRLLKIFTFKKKKKKCNKVFRVFLSEIRKLIFQDFRNLKIVLFICLQFIVILDIFKFNQIYKENHKIIQIYRIFCNYYVNLVIVIFCNYFVNRKWKRSLIVMILLVNPLDSNFTLVQHLFLESLMIKFFFFFIKTRSTIRFLSFVQYK